MQAKEELLEQLGETYGYVSRLIEQRIEYFKLNLAEGVAKTASSLIGAIILFILGLITFIFALITLGFALTESFDSGVYGFGLVTIILLFLVFLIMLLRRMLITDPIVGKMINKFFEHEGKDV